MIRRALLAVVFGLGLATSAGAQTYPALHDVTGVGSGDVLNIRAQPDASAEIVGSFAADATGIEVTAATESGGWGRVNAAEGIGWASLAFLAPQPMGAMPDVAKIACFGTEPFWSYQLEAGVESRFALAGEEPVSFLAGPTERASGRVEPFISKAGGPDSAAVLVMRSDSSCSDGMSDRLFGLSATLVLSGATRGTFDGCCSLSAD